VSLSSCAYPILISVLVDATSIDNVTSIDRSFSKGGTLRATLESLPSRVVLLFRNRRRSHAPDSVTARYVRPFPVLPIFPSRFYSLSSRSGVRPSREAISFRHLSDLSSSRFLLLDSIESPFRWIGPLATTRIVLARVTVTLAVAAVAAA